MSEGQWEPEADGRWQPEPDPDPEVGGWPGWSDPARLAAEPEAG